MGYACKLSGNSKAIKFTYNNLTLNVGSSIYPGNPYEFTLSHNISDILSYCILFGSWTNTTTYAIYNIIKNNFVLVSCGRPSIGEKSATNAYLYIESKISNNSFIVRNNVGNYISPQFIYFHK